MNRTAWAMLVASILVFVGCGLPEQSVKDLHRARRGAQFVIDGADSTDRERDLGYAVLDLTWAIEFDNKEVDQLPPDVRVRLEADRRNDQ